MALGNYLSMEIVYKNVIQMMDRNEYGYCLIRSNVEQAEEWRKWCHEIPKLKFDSDWEVRIIPPFGGAIVRFTVSKGDNFASIYFDAYSELGWMYDEDEKPIPYWEIFTDDISGYPHRYLLSETEELLEDIRSIMNG